MSPSTTTPARTAGAAARDAAAGAAVFGLIPPLTPVAPLAAAAVGALGVLLATRWPIRLLVAAFTATELVGLPWPTACFVGAVVYWLGHPSSHARLRAAPSRKRSSAELTAYGAVGLLCGLLVVALDATAIREGYVFPLRIPPLWAIPVLGVLLAVVNAVGEELLWRFALVDLLEPVGRPVLTAVVQAGSFGIAHCFGIPNGVVGVMAAAAYAAVLMLVSTRAGLLAAIGTHVITDAVIFLAVAQHARFAWSGG